MHSCNISVVAHNAVFRARDASVAGLSLHLLARLAGLPRPDGLRQDPPHPGLRPRPTRPHAAAPGAPSVVLAV